MRPGILPVPDGKAPGVTTSEVLAFCGRLFISDLAVASLNDVDDNGADGEEGVDGSTNGSSEVCGGGAAVTAPTDVDEEATTLLLSSPAAAAPAGGE